MQDVSRVTGDPVILKPKSKDGREFVVRGVTFEDLGFLQDELLTRKRRAKINTAKLVLEILGDPREREKTLAKAQADAEAIAYVSMEELVSFIATEEGIVTFLWCLLDRQYPGEFTRNSLMEMMLTGELSLESIERLMRSLVGNRLGNLTGQTADSPTSPALGDGGMRSGFSSNRRKREDLASRRQRRKN